MPPLFPKQMSLCAFFPHFRFSQSPLFVPFSFPSLLGFAFPSYPPYFYWFCGSVLNIFLFILLPTLSLIFNLRRKLSGGENLFSRRKLKGKHTNKTIKGNTDLHYALPFSSHLLRLSSIYSPPSILIFTYLPPSIFPLSTKFPSSPYFFSACASFLPFLPSSSAVFLCLPPFSFIFTTPPFHPSSLSLSVSLLPLLSSLSSISGYWVFSLCRCPHFCSIALTLLQQ